LSSGTTPSNSARTGFDLMLIADEVTALGRRVSRRRRGTAGSSAAMNGIGRQAPHCQRRESSARRLRQRNGCNGRRRQRHHQQQAADAAAIDANFAVALVRGRCGLPSDNAMAQDAARLGGGFGCGAPGADTRDQAGQRNRVSGSERDDAPPQRVPSEVLAHRSSSVPEDAVTTNTLTTNKFRRQCEKLTLVLLGQTGYRFPTSSHDVVQNTFIPRALVYGGSIHYSRLSF